MKLLGHKAFGSVEKKEIALTEEKSQKNKYEVFTKFISPNYEKIKNKSK